MNTTAEEMAAVIAAQTIDLFRLREQVRQLTAEGELLKKGSTGEAK
jgi:hypothetical protein